jgi:3-hydroxyisobutyrate dehydrogenase
MTTIGIIGLGNMGRGMAMSLRRGGFTVLGFDAAAATRERLANEGIAIAEDIGAICAEADVIVLSLPTAAIVEAVVGGEGGIAEAGRAGLVIVDTSTSHPDTSRKLAARLAEKGIGFVDAPVSGGPAGALAGTMTMVIGGAEADVARVMPVLEAMSATRVLVGPVGAGHATKIINNLLCAAHLLTAAEAVRLARAAGLDPARMLEGINAGSGRSGVTLVNYPKWILNEAFDSGFTMQLMRKDVRLAAQVIGELGLALPLAAETARLWQESAATIGDAEDFNRIVGLVPGAAEGVQ